MTTALRFPFLLTVLLGAVLVALGAEIRCTEAGARPTLGGLQAEVDAVEQRVTAIEEVVEFPPLCPAQRRRDHDSDIASFTVDIPDAPEASKNIREIAIDELNIDARETTTGLDVEYRTYSPGAAHWGQAKFTSACAEVCRRDSETWWQEAAKGNNIRKNITVTLFKSDKSPGRSYHLIDCFPTKLSPLPSDSCSGEQQEQLTVQCERIDFEIHDSPAPVEAAAAGSAPEDGAVVANAEAGTGDKFAQVRGFKVEITGAGSGSDVDSAWETVSGGELVIEPPTTTVGSDGQHTTTPGHKYIDTLTLRGPLTSSRKAMLQWLMDTASGRDWKRELTITELLSVDGAVKDGKQYICQDVFPIGYVFPRMAVTNVTGNVMEEVRLKPVRCELQ